LASRELTEANAGKKPSSVLDLIERAGNKVPHPAILFLALCVAVIVLSQILYLADARITAEVVKPPPATVLAAFRVGDSPGNVINPIMPYFPLIVVFARRYDKRSGIGTVIALMAPFFIAMAIVWTLFFIAWYLIGTPFGIST